MTEPRDTTTGHVVVTADGEHYGLDAYLHVGQSANMTLLNDALVDVRYTTPTYDKAAHAKDRYRKMTTTPRAIRIEQTAALAARLGLWVRQPDEAMVTALVDAAPNELRAIWDSLPGVRWLSRTLAASPISWGRGAK